MRRVTHFFAVSGAAVVLAGCGGGGGGGGSAPVLPSGTYTGIFVQNGLQGGMVDSTNGTVAMTVSGGTLSGTFTTDKSTVYQFTGTCDNSGHGKIHITGQSPDRFIKEHFSPSGVNGWGGDGDEYSGTSPSHVTMSFNMDLFKS
jgi:hypothetical protein